MKDRWFELREIVTIIATGEPAIIMGFEDGRHGGKGKTPRYEGWVYWVKIVGDREWKAYREPELEAMPIENTPPARGFDLHSS